MCLAGPLVLVSLLQYSLQTISVMFVGHLGQVCLSGASMATSFAGVTGFSLMVNIFFLLTKDNYSVLLLVLLRFPSFGRLLCLTSHVGKFF